MRTIVMGLAAAGLLGACSGDTASEAQKATKAQALEPGEYEVTAKVDAIRSTDDGTPATASAAANPPAVTRTCVAAGGTIPPAAFAEAGETCTATDSYMRGGRMSLQFKCNREGKGLLTQMVDGNFTADGFTGEVMTATYFTGTGDYELTRTITGKRVGECAAEPADAAANATGAPAAQ